MPSREDSMKPQKGDIWKITEGENTWHLFIVEDGRTWPTGSYTSYKAITLETGHHDELYYSEESDAVKVA